MLEKNDLVRDTIRMFLSEVQRYEIDSKEEVDDTKALQIINKMIKQRNDSISQFKDGGRDDLADKEQSEVDILSMLAQQELELHIFKTKMLEFCGQSKLVAVQSDVKLAAISKYGGYIEFHDNDR